MKDVSKLFIFLLLCPLLVFAQENSPFELRQIFKFDKQLDFEMLMHGKIIKSHIYFNTISGYSMLDKDFFSQFDEGKDIDYQITFPMFQEQFIYTTNPSDDKKRGAVMHKPIVLATEDLSDMSYFLSYFQNFVTTGEVQNLGEKGDFHSEEYAHSNPSSGNDTKFWISKDTDVIIKPNYSCLSWLGLGYINTTGRTLLISKVSTGNNYFQINLVAEKNSQKTFDGNAYESISVFIDDQIESMAAKQAESQQVFTESLEDVEDAHERQLREELNQLQVDDQNQMMDVMKQMSAEDGKVTDVYAAANSALDPVKKINIQKAELKIEEHKIQQKIEKENAKENPSEKSLKIAKLQLDKVDAKINLLDVYKIQLEKVQRDLKEKPMELMNKNVEVFMEMHLKLNDIESKFEKDIKNVKK